MTETSTDVSGQCLCGAVTFSARLKDTDVGVCHCGMCRRWTGGVFLALQCAAPLRIDETDALAVYTSSDWGERGFCKVCGTSLFWRTRDQQHVVVSAMALDALPDTRLVSEIFVDEKPDYYSFAQPTHKMTGAEVFEKFAPKNG